MRKTTLLVLAAALCVPAFRHRRARPDGGFFAV